MKKQMFTRRIMLATMLALFACLQSFAVSSKDFYSKAVANVSPTGAGTVYVSNKSAADAESGTHAESSEATNKTTAATPSYPIHTYYMHATPAEDKFFAGWAKTAEGEIESTDNPLTLSVTSSTSEDPTAEIRYAIFKETVEFYSTVTVNATEGGRVYVATEVTDAPAWAATATASQSSMAGKATQHDYYLYARADDDYVFMGWSTTPDGDVISKEESYKVSAKAESNDAENATKTTYYAKFKKREYYHSQVWGYVVGEGSILVNIIPWEQNVSYNSEKAGAFYSSLAVEVPTHDYYLYAKAEAGSQFVGWSKSQDGSNILSTESPYNIKIKADSQDENNPVTEEYYAIFKKIQTYYSKVWVHPGDGGSVILNTTGEEPGYYSSSLQVNAVQNSEALQTPKHSYYLFAKAKDGYMFEGWATTADGEVLISSNKSPFDIDVEALSTDISNPTDYHFYAKFKPVPGHYSKLTLKLNGNNDISNLGTAMLGGKVYVGKTAEEAESAQYEWTSESTQVTIIESTPTHEYYLYAKADEGFEFAGFGTTASATTSFNNQGVHPYKVTIDAASTDEAAPSEKVYYASFKYAADNKPTTAYANFTLVAMLAEDDGTGKYVNVESAEAGMLAINYNDAASGSGANTAEPVWHSGSSYASEAYSKPYTSGTIYFPFTIFAKANPGYEFVGWASTSTSTAPSQKGTLVDDYSYYYADSYTRTSVSNANYPGSCGIEGGPKTKKYYAVFKKLEQMEEPTGETTVEVTDVKGTTELVEGSVTSNFTVDLVLSENLPYDKPGSDKNAKPVEVLKQFVTVEGANGNKSNVANFSLVSESHDRGETSDGNSAGTTYTCNTLRLSFPYNIKADTYTVHLPYGLYTTVNDNKTPTYEFTITVTENTNTHLTIKKQTPREGLQYKYTSAGGQFSEDKRDFENGLVDVSNITVEIEFNEVVNSIDHSKATGITLTNTTEGVNYRYTNLSLPAELFGKVDGRTAIAYPELVNGSYTMTIPEGLFVGTGDKVNEEITINFSVSGFRNATLKPYEMTTDVITPKANDMTQTIEALEKIEISYKGEFGVAETIVGNASDIKIQRYTEVINGNKDGGSSERTYYPVSTTPIVEVVDGKMVVSFFPAIEATGMYEVQIPAGMAANMEPGEMTMVEKVNAGYALTPAYPNLSFNVKAPELEVTMFVSSAAKYGTFIAPFDVEIPAGVTASTVHNCQDGTLILEPLTTSTLLANTPVILQSEETVQETFKGEVSRYFDPEESFVDGYLVGVYQKIKAPVNSYVLQMQNNKVAFYIVKEEVGQPDILPYRCYLSEGAAYGAPALYFVEDDATSINGTNPEFINAEAIYNVNGVRMNTLQKGLNIIKTANGTKKVVIK